MAIDVGTKVTGKVSGITNFGAFIDLGDHQSGLVHISEVSNKFIKDVHDVLTVGDEVEAKVISVDKGKIALSIKATLPKEQQTRPQMRPRVHSGGTRTPKKVADNKPVEKDFDSLLSSFMKDSESRLSSLKRNTDGKRGGRGGRRS